MVKCCESKEIHKIDCPLCKKTCDHIFYLKVRLAVKKDLQKWIQNENFFFCKNADCPGVFFNENKDIIILIQDIDISSDIIKSKNKCKKHDKF